MARTAIVMSCAALLMACAAKSMTDPVGSSQTPEEAAAAPPAAAEPEPLALDCGEAIRGSDALPPGGILLVGEMHGTRETPELVGRLACDAAKDGAMVLLGLESASDNQAAVDTYLASEGTDGDRSILLAAPHFASDTKDGRNSEAMLGLVDAVRRWRQAGANLEIVCFDAPEGSYKTGVERDAAMAEALVAAREAQPEATLVTLSGNIHNRTHEGTPWDPTYVAMGVHLREAFPELISVDVRSAGGGLWVCMGAGEEFKCGAAKMGGEDRGAEAFVELYDERNEAGFDGFLYVGPTTASEPAVAQPPAASTSPSSSP